MEKQFKKSRGRILSTVTAILLALTLVAGLVPQVAAEPVYGAALGADAFKVVNIGDRGIMQGGTAEIVMSLESLKEEQVVFDEAELRFEQEIRGMEITPSNMGTITLSKGGKADIRFSLKIGKFFETGVKSYCFILKNKGEVIFTSSYYEIEVKKFISTGEEGTNYVSGVDLEYEIDPAEGFARGSHNYIRFHVFNVGNNTVKNTVLTLTMPEGIGINNGSDSYNIGYISSGDDKYGEFNIFVGDQVYTDNYKFTATVTGVDQGGNAVTFTKNFYIQVKGKPKKDTDEEEEDITGEKNPRLMLSNYSIGANSVLAGSSFNLALDIKNTSSKKLQNAKVSVTSDGTFVPVGGSNSFFIESVEPGATVAKSLRLNVIPEAEQKTTAITVHIEYEDTKGNPLTSDDTIAVKVNQKTRLVVDDIVPPMEIFVGNGSSATVDFYNMGKTVLSNLRVQAEGNFDVYESNSYFAGNMASGAKDSYSFNFVPREVGPVEGTITFTYDDVEGNPQSMQTTFSFEAIEMPNFDEGMGGMDMPMETKPKIPKSVWIFGIVLLALLIGFLIFRKIRKHQLNKKLELEDAAFEAAMSNGAANGNSNGAGTGNGKGSGNDTGDETGAEDNK